MMKKMCRAAILGLVLSVSSVALAEETTEADAQTKDSLIPVKQGLWEYSSHITGESGQKTGQLCIDPADDEKAMKNFLYLVPPQFQQLCPPSKHYERLSEHSESMVIECASPDFELHHGYWVNHQSDNAITTEHKFRFNVMGFQLKWAYKTNAVWLRECQEGDRLYSDVLEESREIMEALWKEAVEQVENSRCRKPEE